MMVREQSKLRILAVTFNMAGLGPDKSPRTLFDSMFQKDNIEHDIYVLGTQEACKPIANSMVSPCKEELNKAILKYFRHSSKKKFETERSDFVQVSSISLAAIHMIVLVRKEYLAQLSDIKTDTISFGFGNFMPNKGAVSVSFRIGAKKLLFINCHLDAHIENRVRRAEQFNQIRDQMVNGV